MAITTNTTTIEKTEHDGQAYYTTTARGVEYCAHFMESVGKWFVSTRRLALGRGNGGGGKYWDKLEDCKPFAALPTLMKLGAI
jgi:DNA-binding PadR family transcriptional regulator